jgi:DNA-binding beta-propeller fold protein YncE
MEQLTRRSALRAFGLLLGAASLEASSAVSTVIGTGSPGYSARDVNNPYGVLVVGGSLYFCDLDNQRIRRLDLKTGRTTTVAGNGRRGYGGPATAASLDMPHEIQLDAAGNLYVVERDNHVVRRVDARTGIASTIAGTGVPGFAGDGGAAVRAQLRSPHSIVFAPDGRLLICDVGNHRIRRVDMRTGIIETYAGTGARAATPDGAPVTGTPLNGPRTLAVDDQGDLYVALREGNAIFRIASRTATLHHVAGTGEPGYSGDDGPARLATFAGPKGLAYSRGRLYVADTENHVIRLIDLRAGTLTTVLGTGQRGDGPEGDPLKCRLARPHGVFSDAAGALYVGDSEAHRIRVLRG